MTDDPTAAPLPALPNVDMEAVVKAMAADGVDMSDPAAVREWLARADVDLGDVLDEDEDLEFDEDVSLKEVFGLPDRLPPLRLPLDEELADAARASRLLGRAKALAEWIGDGRPVTEDGEPTGADCVDAARALGIDPPESVERLDDVPELLHLWELAAGVELIEFGEDDLMHRGPALPVWPDGDDEDVLDVWATALAVTMTSLDLDADLADSELDFYGVGGAVLVSLFLARSSGVPYAELTELIRESATPGPSSAAWDQWVAASGEPTHVLLARLDELGAVILEEEVARLTPLALWAMWAQLMDSDVEVPLLPPVEEMTAADLVAAAAGLTEEELTAETSAWLDLRSPGAAAAELLEVAAEGEPADRMYATTVVTTWIGDAADPHWRAALDDQRLSAYAKLALNLQPEPEDLAWLLTDVLAATSEVDGAEDIASQLGDAVPAGQEQELFEVMWRLPHPAAGEVLTLLGQHHPDKGVAKAARKAAFKAASARS